jgi:hypothetical protein
VLTAVGIDSQTTTERGRVGVDAAGRPNGLLEEAATEFGDLFGQVVAPERLGEVDPRARSGSSKRDRPELTVLSSGRAAVLAGLPGEGPDFVPPMEIVPAAYSQRK